LARPEPEHVEIGGGEASGEAESGPMAKKREKQ